MKILKEKNLAVVFGAGGAAILPRDPIVVTCDPCGKLDSFDNQFDAELAATIHVQKNPSHVVTGKRKNVRLFRIQGDK